MRQAMYNRLILSSSKSTPPNRLNFKVCMTFTFHLILQIVCQSQLSRLMTELVQNIFLAHLKRLNLSCLATLKITLVISRLLTKTPRRWQHLLSNCLMLKLKQVVCQRTYYHSRAVLAMLLMRFLKVSLNLT